jgi:hypothetical protein
MFKEYLHIEKFGNDEVENIELGVVYVYPKLDGTNASVWRVEGHLFPSSGSRTRQLEEGKDNFDFREWVIQNCGLFNRVFDEHPKWRLYGEWLVPHTFKGYRGDAWKRFYVFDVYSDEIEQYLSYEVYKEELEKFGIDFIPPLAIVRNGEYTRFMHYLSQNFFMIPDGGEPGEGVVLKNYDYQNKFGRQAFAKLIRNEFKEMHVKAMGAPEVNNSKMNEERILEKVLSIHLVDKTIEKIRHATGAFNKRDIPRLFETVFYDIIREELWDSWKEIGFGSINGKTLKALVINKIKELKPEIFK